jgi:hypothetical protein
MRRAAMALVLALAAAGCGSGGASGPLGWSGAAETFTHPTLPGDRVLTGRLRNEGLRRVRVDIGDVRVLDADGEPVPAAPVFLQTFGKSLWSPGRGPETIPDSELLRTGRIALLRPGDEVPFTVAWHARDGEPARVDWGGGSLEVPG